METRRPYDAGRMEFFNAQFAAAWRELEKTRADLYLLILPRSFRLDDNGDPVLCQAADKAWSSATGLPPLDSLEHLQIIEAAAVAEGFNVTRAGLRCCAMRWALRRGGIEPRRIFWLCKECFGRCNPGECPTIGTLATYANCPICGVATNDARNFTPIFARDIRVELKERATE